MKRLLLPLQAALTLGVLAVVARRVDVHAAAASVRHASPAWLTFALVMNLLAVSLSARLWATLMPERKSGYAKLWHLYVMGLFYNNLGLGTVLGDGFRYAQLRRDGEDASRSAASVLGERLLSGVALLALAALGSLYFVPSRPLVTAAVWAAVVAAFFAGALATRMLPRVSPRVPLPAPFRREGAGVRDATRDLARRRPTVVAGFAWACGVQCCTILATFCLVRALGVGVEPLACFAVVPVIALAVLLPISIQGIGV
ncbi:MAG TPA: lysylphosphatidylglycerol synthase transmembrane domain-containing protein, partial [Dehalococcoidia bacterium]|nr:lysylphosphatidylglycerol synthase transmembrane domain-containing protein [Dehalococcoidia bacterium]